MIFDTFAWILTPLIPALVALYFLKLRRRDLVVSSTLLWKRTLEDLHVNAPFQRLRRSLLLLLQLLILLAVIAAASRPMISGTGRVGVTRLLLIDRSASMNVEEAAGTRLELARAKALEIIDGMDADDRAAIVAFDRKAELLESLTGDSAKLRRAVGSIEATSYPTELLPALETAASMAESSASAEVLILSDGAFEPLSTVSPELERLRIRFSPVGELTENVGITEMDVRRSFARGEKVEVFAGLTNTGSTAQVVTLGVYDGDRLVDSARVEIPPKKTRSHVLDGSEYVGKMLRLELDPGGALRDDDRAWVRLDAPRPLSVLIVGEPNWFLKKMMQAQPRFEARRASLESFQSLLAGESWDEDPADLVIFDGAASSWIPDRPSLYLGCYPPLPEFSDVPTVKNPGLVDWDAVHPTNRYIAFADLRIAESLIFPETASLHSTLDSGEGSIAASLIITESGRPAVSALLLGFSVKQTNWPWLPSFPMYFSNAISWLGASRTGSATARYRTGELLRFRPARTEEAEFYFTVPGGAQEPARVSPSSEIVFAATESIGVYELRLGEDRLERFPVSLLNARESRIEPGDELQIGSSGVVSAEEIEESRDLWKWFALFALVAVLAEWWVYNKRITV